MGQSLSPKGRQRYWDETVFEAVAELRKRLRSQDAEVALEALEMILDLGKTRIRHGKQLSGTHVPHLPDLEDDWGNPLPTAPEKKTSPPVPVSAGTPGLPGRSGIQANGEGVFKPETVPTNRESDKSPERKHQPVIPLNTPSPFMERGPGGEVPRIPGVTFAFTDHDASDPSAYSADFNYPSDHPEYAAYCRRRESGRRRGSSKIEASSPTEGVPCAGSR